MNRLTANGKAIRLRRKQHARLSTQEALAFEIGISARKLRDLERKNAPLEARTAERIAELLGAHLSEIATLPLVAPQHMPARKNTLQGKQLVPRFDEDFARFVPNEEALFGIAASADVVKVDIQVALVGETLQYAEELTALVREATWEQRDRFSKLDAVTALTLRRRMRELLVLLKGNDIWVYALHHTKRLPESYEVPLHRGTDVEWHAIIAFGPPGEYGEDSVTVGIDHGYPFIIDWDEPLFCPVPAAEQVEATSDETK